MLLPTELLEPLSRVAYKPASSMKIQLYLVIVILSQPIHITLHMSWINGIMKIQQLCCTSNFFSSCFCSFSLAILAALSDDSCSRLFLLGGGASPAVGVASGGEGGSWVGILEANSESEGVAENVNDCAKIYILVWKKPD